MVSGNWSLIADSGPEKGQQIPIRHLTKIGRAMECDISILEPVLSRQHAELVADDGKLVIKDLGSSNGTYVNGKKITEEQELKDDDILQFHKIKFIVRSPI
jgi:pSer/pThr/pTyr-binding forkhead associated (FHA) protein